MKKPSVKEILILVAAISVAVLTIWLRDVSLVVFLRLVSGLFIGRFLGIHFS